MSARRPAAAIALALLAGCSRDLSVPSIDPVTLSPGAATVAPRERLALTGVGGAGGYRFVFEGNQRPSGDDAVLDAVTGSYRAGSRGSAQDVVIVTDSAGVRASARIAVGPRLVVTPSAAVTSPGGTLEVVASGGRPPYAFTLADAQGATSLVVSGEDAAVFRAGPLGDRTERIVVTDATWDAADPSAAVAECAVRIGSPVKVYANAPAEVAPFEIIDFLAVGGQPPYAFDFANRSAGSGLPPSGGSIDPITGRYRAGLVGTAPGTVAGQEVADLVVAHDAYGQVSAAWRVVLGAPLALSLSDAALSPGRAVQLTASGGRPPYAFGFAARGNRSRGAVDAVTGVYVPGPGQGTFDALTVTDATGIARATIDRAPTVGYRELPVGDYAGLVLPARLRGDSRPVEGSPSNPRQDALVFHYASGGMFMGLTSVFFPAASDPQVSHGYLDGLGDFPFIVDLDGDGHDDLVTFRSQPSARVITLLAGVNGELTEGPVLDLTAAHWWYLVAKSTADPRWFYTTIGCGGTPATGIIAVNVGATSIASSCLPHPDAAELVDLMYAPIAAADLDGDGVTDLAWPVSTGVKVSYRIGGAFQPAVTVPAPAGCTVGGRWFHWAEGGMVPFSAAPGAAKKSVALTLGCGAAERVARLDGGTPAARTPTFDPAGGVTLGATPSSWLLGAFAPAPGAAGVLAAWSRTTSALPGVRFDATGVGTTDLAPALPMNVEWAGFPDVDGDGTPDLLAVGSSLDAYLLLGDGDGRFGMQPRLRGAVAWAPAGDLDGDGVADAVVATDDRALAILLGGGDQLAWTQQVPLQSAPSAGALTVADFLGTGQRAVTYQDPLGTFYRVPIGPGPSLGPPQPIQLSGSVSRQPYHRVADLGGAAPGPDIWWLDGAPSTRNLIEAVVFDTTTTAHGVQSRIPDPYYGCGLLPSGVGGFNVVAVCPDATSNGIIILTADGNYGPYVQLNGWAGLPGATQGNAKALAVGRKDDGTAVFVATPSGPSGTRHRYAVTVTRNPLAAAVQDLGTEDAIPAGSALLADVDGDGTPDLVLLANGTGRVLLGAPSGGGTTYSLGPTFRAAGTPEAALHLGAIPGSDLVIHMGDDLVIVPHAGGGQLR
jgi:hypothetical protein